MASISTRPPAGLSYRVATARDAMLTFEELEPAELADLERSYDYLNFPAQAAILSELGQGLPGKVRTISDRELQDFLDSEEGQILGPHWRSRTTKNLSIAKYRAEQIYNRLDAYERGEVERLVNDLSVAQQVAVLVALTS